MIPITSATVRPEPSRTTRRAAATTTTAAKPSLVGTVRAALVGALAMAGGAAAALSGQPATLAALRAPGRKLLGNVNIACTNGPGSTSYQTGGGGNYNFNGPCDGSESSRADAFVNGGGGNYNQNGRRLRAIEAEIHDA